MPEEETSLATPWGHVERFGRCTNAQNLNTFRLLPQDTDRLNQPHRCRTICPYAPVNVGQPMLPSEGWNIGGGSGCCHRDISGTQQVILFETFVMSRFEQVDITAYCVVGRDNETACRLAKFPVLHDCHERIPQHMSRVLRTEKRLYDSTSTTIYPCRGKNVRTF